ncbi:DUF3137 domain-containing protein [Aureispira anguillae]|uniref:DUF3137 domain-containing protein n=1 Tax=Aureispira anguillae TaxID=2864201 RepID=A0A916DP57_9BACT|nr:DUF3137 domain-containing protein [Aureispira anguillae]BDS10329.1 DUF3137 domain-containing protein [Aureispira anguillae]
MKSLNDIRRQITPALHSVEQFRTDQLETIRREKQWFVLPIIIFCAALWATFLGYILLVVMLVVSGFLVFVWIGIFKIEPQRLTYVNHFKMEAFSAFVKMLYPNTYYAPSNYLPSVLFSKSKLFGSYTSYSGKDYFEGQTDNACSFKFSELDVTNVHSDTKNELGNTTTILFKGMFFVLDVSHYMNGYTQILPTSTEHNLEGIEHFIPKKIGDFFKREAMIDMEEHPEFGEEFVVYSKDEKEAFRILTPNLLKAIYDLRYKWKASLSISFIERQIYIALPHNKNLFYPDIRRSILKDTALEEIYDELGLCFAVIEDLSQEHQPSENWEQLNNINYKTGYSKNNPFLM